MTQSGSFDVEEQLARLSGLDDQLEAFRPDLNMALSYSDERKGGRPPFVSVLMFKILVIQTLNNLSDERTECLINDRLSFIRFLGLGRSLQGSGDTQYRWNTSGGCLTVCLIPKRSGCFVSV